MLKWLACTAALHQFAQRCKLRFTQPALELQIQVYPLPAQYVRQQVLRVQTWTFDVALLEIARCRLQDLEHSHVAAYLRKALLARSRLRHRAADGPGNFFARDEPVRIAAAWIYDVFAAFQIVKTTGVPAVGTPHREEPINTLHNFARLHFLCTISTKAAKFIVRVAKS